MGTSTSSAVVHREGDLYVADCPELGTVSQGRTVEEALANLRGASELRLEATGEMATGEPPLPTTFTVGAALAAIA